MRRSWVILRVDELIEGPEDERNGRFGPGECGSDIALHRGALATIRIDGQDDRFPRVARYWASGAYIVAIMPSRGEV